MLLINSLNTRYVSMTLNNRNYRYARFNFCLFMSFVLVVSMCIVPVVNFFLNGILVGLITITSYVLTVFYQLLYSFSLHIYCQPLKGFIPFNKT